MECQPFALGNLDFLARLRVMPRACRHNLLLERTKSDDADAVAEANLI